MRSLSYLFALSLILLTKVALGQSGTYKFEDNTNVAVDVISTNPDDGHNSSIYIGYFGPEGINWLGFNHYKPGKFFINGVAGSEGWLLDGDIFFSTKTKPITLSQSVKQEAGNYRTITRYVIKIPAEKRVSYGLHMGINRIDYAKRHQIDSSYPEYSAMGIFAGLSILKAKHTEWKIFDSYQSRQGTMINRVHLDGIYYISRNLSDSYEGEESIDYYAREVGVRLYYDGRASLWSRGGRISLNYMLGLAINSNKINNSYIFAGLGLGYNFSPFKN